MDSGAIHGLRERVVVEVGQDLEEDGGEGLLTTLHQFLESRLSLRWVTGSGQHGEKRMWNHGTEEEAFVLRWCSEEPSVDERSILRRSCIDESLTEGGSGRAKREKGSWIAWMGPITEFAVEVMDDPCGGKTGNALGSSEPLKRPDR